MNNSRMRGISKGKKSIGANAVLNVSRQCLSFVFPLITYPYALHTLGVESIGKVNYAGSIVSYFSLIAALGVSTYAIREGAKIRDDKEKLNKFVSEIFTVNLLSTAVAYILLISCLVLVDHFESYRLLIFLSSLSIILTTLGVDWINNIFEDFLIITIRSILSHVLLLILLFVFVHEPSDYYAYALLTVSGNALTCVMNLFYCRKYVRLRITRRPNIRVHMVPLLVLFANYLAISIYTNSDTTMLGWFKGDYYVGLYAVSVKIYGIVKGLLTAIYNVAIPRLATNSMAEGHKEYRKLTTDLWAYLSLLIIPCSAGLICVAPEILYIFGGSEYVEAVTSLRLLAVALCFAIFGGLVTVCMNVTLGREKENLKATLIAALLNFGLNFIAIPLFAQDGAAATTIIAEIFVFAFCFIRLPNKGEYLEGKTVCKSVIHSLAGSVCMLVFAFFIRGYFTSYLSRLAVIVIGCIVIYTVVLALLRDTYLFSAILFVSGKIRRKS